MSCASTDPECRHVGLTPTVRFSMKYITMIVNRHLTLIQIRTNAVCPLFQQDEESLLNLLDSAARYLLNA